jgi:Protein of unknown function (DUF1376)
VSAPPVDPDIDLTALPYFPLLRRRLFRSEFNLKATDSEWRAGMTLWVRSFDQMPAGSLPNDETQLQRLAGLARQPRKWRRVKAMALHGWKICDDGRLYHATIAEVVNYAVRSRRQFTESAPTRGRTRREPRLKSMADFAGINGKGSAPDGASPGARSRARRPAPTSAAVNLFLGAFNAVQNYTKRNSSDPTDSGIDQPLAGSLLDRRRSC